MSSIARHAARPEPSPVPEHLTGLIERVTYHNPDSGFCVLRVDAPGEAANRREPATVIGTLPEVRAGEWVDATGRWAIDPTHGRQFRAHVIRTAHPETLDGMEKYLGSGLIKGIGPKFAANLVGQFGTGVFDVIEREPAKLLDVPGIGKTRQRKIVGAWKDQRAVREIMVFLHAHGVGTSRAFRIYKTYGDAAVDRVREDPYRLARDIRGIGFKTADQVAESLGIGRQSDLRARAGVEFVLQELTDDGHCAFPRQRLVAAAVKMLEIPAEIIEAAVEHGLAKKRLVSGFDAEGNPLVYLAALDAAEQSLAANLAALARGPHPCAGVDAEQACRWVEGEVDVRLADGQREAIARALRSKVLVITGGPGVGKTTLVNAIVRIVARRGLAVTLCAPTGRAAKRLAETTGREAKTIHRLLEFDPAAGGFKRSAANPLEGDVFVVDETSMVDLPLANQFVRAVPLSAALILVGDVDQLPPVGPGSVLRDVIAAGTVPVCRLTEVFRQAAESDIIANAHRVNRGSMLVFPPKPAEGQQAADCYFAEVDDPEAAAVMIRRLIRRDIPRRFGLRPLDDVQVLTPMQRGELGARSLNVGLQAALNPDGPCVERYGCTFRVGDKVMQTVNNYDKDVFNGDVGRIVSLDGVEQELTVAFDDRRISYDFQELDELTLAYATTIHKAQGSEYPAVVIPIHTQHYTLLQRNLLYTALTRAKRLAVLVGTRRALAIAIQRTDVNRRITTLADRLRRLA